MDNYKVVFDYTGSFYGSIGDFIKEYMQAKYVIAYNAYCELVNPMYEIWNKKFNELYPDVSKEEYYELYTNYIRGKQIGECSKINEKYGFAKSPCSLYYAIDENCQFIGRTENGKYGIGFHLEKVS